jgi:hypothetical protein
MKTSLKFKSGGESDFPPNNVVDVGGLLMLVVFWVVWRFFVLFLFLAALVFRRGGLPGCGFPEMIGSCLWLLLWVCGVLGGLLSQF